MQLRKVLPSHLLIIVLLIAFVHKDNAQGQDLTVTINVPFEDEVLYAGPQVPRYAIPISGKVKPVNGAVTKVTLQLEIFKNGHSVGLISGHPDPNGLFKFMATVNPDAPQMSITVDKKGCAACHAQSTEASLPSGKCTLTLTATDALGHQTSINRHIFVDRSGWADLLVHVDYAGDALTSLQGLPVSAATHFQVMEITTPEIRPRNFTGSTDAMGNVSLRVEALAESSTNYLISIPATVISGTLVSSIDTAHISLPASAKTASPVTITAKSVRGHIDGRLELLSSKLPGGLSVYAIERKSGRAYTTRVSNNLFDLIDLPICSYLIELDQSLLAAHGFSSDTEPVDLTSTSTTAHVDLTIKSLPAPYTRGVVQALTGEPLPFAWAVDDNSGQNTRLDIINGKFSLPATKAGTRTISIFAPGYWSQEQVTGKQSENASMYIYRLKERPDTINLTLSGNGLVKVPSVTVANASRERLDLSRGWVWGTTGNESYRISLPKGSILLEAGSHFAIERSENQIPWLYVMSGAAKVSLPNQNSEISVGSGKMLSLIGNTPLEPLAVPIDSAVLSLLHADDSNPLSFEGEPTISARIHNGLAQFGINAAQLFALVTYSAVVLAILSLPLPLFFWWLRIHRGN